MRKDTEEGKISISINGLPVGRQDDGINSTIIGVCVTIGVVIMAFVVFGVVLVVLKRKQDHVVVKIESHEDLSTPLN